MYFRMQNFSIKLQNTVNMQHSSLTVKKVGDSWQLNFPQMHDIHKNNRYM